MENALSFREQSVEGNSKVLLITEYLKAYFVHYQHGLVIDTRASSPLQTRSRDNVQKTDYSPETDVRSPRVDSSVI